MATIRVDVPEAFEPLIYPRRYKGAYGGRGGAKSHFFAEQMIIRCFSNPIRCVCIREVQQSIRDSVRQLLVDKIQKLDLGWFFEVFDAEIRGKNGSLIIFRGMQSYNAETIKSLEGYDVAWVEEAQTLSEKSLELLRPTIRKEGSELWFSWNPRNRTDPVDVFFRKTPHPDSVAVPVNWRDNPWFPEVLNRERLHDVLTDPELAEHIWEGGYGMTEGAILTRLVDHAEKEGRINEKVVYDEQGPGVEISSDIGFRDTAAWWFWQRRIGGYSLLDFDSDSGLDAGEWINRIQERLRNRTFTLAKIWLPHDARNKAFQSRHSALEQFLGAFGAGKCAIVPVTSKLNLINGARTVIRKCEFNRTACEQGLEGLRAWHYAYNSDLQAFSREPEHDWASHPSDAFAYGCQVMQEQPLPEDNSPKPIAGLEGVSYSALLKANDERKWNRERL